MKALIAAGLMFGNLIPVASAALIDRYNRALRHLTGKTTALTEFHIDLSGFSPEIGDELGDPRYLNAGGVNRQFILLTTAQKAAPLLDPTFSFARATLRQFYDLNEPQLFALTARDAVVGEMQTGIFALDQPARLFDIRRITVEADTVGAHVAESRQLGTLITRFRTEADGWRDDVLIADMIGLAKRTGDIARVPVDLPVLTVEQPNYWTAQFGGVYLFRGLSRPAVISTAPRAALGEVPMTALDLSMRNEIADWLERGKLAEPIVQARGADAAEILRQKMEFILVDAADGAGLDLGAGTRADLRKVAQRMGAALPAEFQGLASLLRWVEGGGDWPRITSEHPAYFYTLRARDHADRDLVNMLLAEMSPLDVRQLFILHKDLFYAAYATWPEAKRAWTVAFLTRAYQSDKAGARAALFGNKEGRPGERAPKSAPGSGDMVSRVGPWGASRKDGR